MSAPGDGTSSGKGGDEPPIDRTMAFQKPADGAPPPPSGLPEVPGITLHGEIARGGMGVVYSGRQDFLDRRVAVKFLAMDLRSEQFAARFRREAKILAGIKHPNIVACHSAGTTDAGQSYLVMEFVDGPNLKSWIAENGPLAAAAALRMTKALAGALGHAHALGVIHRDVKPENILLESATSTQIDFAFPFTPKLVDLGLARMTHESADMGLTSPGSVMGTPATMSPEQFDDPDGVDFRSDIYGLGCVLYEMLCGQPAYRGTRLGDIVVQKREPIGPNPCEAITWLPANVGELVSSMLAANRDRRPASYEELAERLEALLAECQNAQPPGTSVGSAVASMGPPTVPPPRATTPPRGSRPPAKPTAPATTSPPAGPGLLKTAEFEFLAAGGAVAEPASAFRDSGELSRPVEPAVPAGAPLPAARSGSKAARMAILATAVLAGVGLGVWAVLRTQGPPKVDQSPAVVPVPAPVPIPAPAPPKEAPKPNTAPGAPVLGGPETAPLNKAVSFVANATDTDGDRLSYRWSSPQSRFVTFAPVDAATTEVRLLDGLPTEQFTLECAVSDGHNPPAVGTKVLSVDAYKPRSLLSGFLSDDSPWTLDDHVLWVQNMEDGSVSCTAEATPREGTCALVDEAYWQLFGRLEAGRFNAPTFAETGVRLEFGDTGFALLCNRTEPQGVRWSVELMQAVRKDGVWSYAPLADKPLRVEWRDENDDGHFAYFSVKRRLDQLTIQIGCSEQKLLSSQTLPVPAVAGEPRLTLFAKGGRGVFRDMKLF